MSWAMICKYTQYRLANLDGQEPNSRMQKHLQGCSSCEEFEEKLGALSFALRASAGSAPVPPSASIPARRATGPRFAIASVAVAAMAGGLLYWSQVRGSESASPADTIARFDDNSDNTDLATHKMPVAQESEASNGTAKQSAAGSMLSKRLGSIGILQSVTPLEEELDALRSDGARGLNRLLALGQRSTADPQ